MRAAFHAIREALTTPLTVSQEGKLTPEEFVRSGDSLVQAFPTFRWHGNSALTKPYLPPDKQYLIMRNIACRERVSSVATSATISEAADDWNQVATTSPEETYDDLDNYRDPSVSAIEAADAGVQRTGDLRLYDMYLVYDTYYACPRSYLVGKHLNGRPLSPDEMMQDIQQDYIDKTATLERHPYDPDLLTVSIHPCRHAQAMKRIFSQMPLASVEQYMPAFLKMLGSMIPTMEYDYTISI